MIARSRVAQPLPARLVLRAAAAGWLIVLVGVAPWIVLGTLNARLRPELPWAAVLTLLGLALFIPWLGGWGWPEGTQSARRRLLRLRRPDPAAWSPEQASGTIAIVLGIVTMYVLWILVSGDQRLTDLSAYPTPAYRISVLVMGALVSGVVEEAAFRGYTQSMLEPWGHERAIVLTSIAFVLAHVTHGVVSMLLMAPGYFIVSYLYGMLAWRTGSILPGMVLHVLGDLLHTTFAVLGGDLGVLVR